MDIEIVCRDFTLTDALEYHVNSKLARLVNWRSRELEFVRVTLGDENGPRGGRDKFCCITIQIVSGALVRIEHRSTSLYDAVSRASERSDRVVREELRKTRPRRRRSLAMMWT